MRGLNLFQRRNKSESAIPHRNAVPVDLKDLKVGDSVLDRRGWVQAAVVAILPNKITYRTESGQYSTLPSDFVNNFVKLREDKEAESNE